MQTITTLSHSPAISIRRAGIHDRHALERLAALDSSVPPRGEVLVAEVDGEPWAAVSLVDGHTVADPFRRSGSIVDLLRARAGHVQPALKQGRPLLAPRYAA